MDETYIKIKGKWHYLYRAIDTDGLTLNIWLRREQDTQTAHVFLKRLVKQLDEPEVVIADKAPSIISAFRKLREYGGFYQGIEHRTIKYLNNLIKQDHCLVKRHNKFYRSSRIASTTIKGMEAIRGLCKKTRKEGTLFEFSACTEIKVLLRIPAQIINAVREFILYLKLCNRTIETMHALYRISQGNKSLFGFSVIHEMDTLMSIQAQN